MTRDGLNSIPFTDIQYFPHQSPLSPPMSQNHSKMNRQTLLISFVLGDLTYPLLVRARDHVAVRAPGRAYKPHRFPLDFDFSSSCTRTNFRSSRLVFFRPSSACNLYQSSQLLRLLFVPSLFTFIQSSRQISPWYGPFYIPMPSIFVQRLFGSSTNHLGFRIKTLDSVSPLTPLTILWECKTSLLHHEHSDMILTLAQPLPLCVPGVRPLHYFQPRLSTRLAPLTDRLHSLSTFALFHCSILY